MFLRRVGVRSPQQKQHRELSVQLKLADLPSHLQNDLRPVYLVAGDETLLVEETCDAVIKTARQQGFTERSVHHAEGSFKWSEIIHDAASISLFLLSLA